MRHIATQQSSKVKRHLKHVLTLSNTLCDEDGVGAETHCATWLAPPSRKAFDTIRSTLHTLWSISSSYKNVPYRFTHS